MRVLIVLATLFMTLNSCGYLILKPMANAHIKNRQEKMIPPDFFKGDNTLVVLLDAETTLSARAYNRKIRKKAMKLYDGPLEFMSEEQYLAAVAPENKDTTMKYRYVFTHTQPVTTTYARNTPFETTNIKARRFYMLDYETKKKYYCTVGGSFYMRVAEAYFNNLQKWRYEAAAQSNNHSQ